jgi:hypothetical protein
MKKLLTFATVASFVALVACGPSQAELDAKAKALADSLALDSAMKAQAAQKLADSLKMVAMQDSMNKVRIADSLRMDSIEKASKKGGSSKPKPQAPKEPEKAPEGAPKVGKKKPGQ